MIHLFTPSFHHLIQIFKQTFIKMFLNLTKQSNLMTQHPYTHLLQTNSSQSNFPSQNQRTSYSNIVQSSRRRSQNPPLSPISITLYIK